MLRIIIICPYPAEGIKKTRCEQRVFMKSVVSLFAAGSFFQRA